MLKFSEFLFDQKIHRSKKLISRPRISVVLPTYCRGDNGLLKRAMDCVLAQKFTDFELIVVDDGSVDGTRDLVSAYVQADDRLVYVRHDINSGLPALRVNEGIMLARADFIAYQFDDDTWTENALASLFRTLEGNEGAVLAYGQTQIKLNENNSFSLGIQPFNFGLLKTSNIIANNSVLHRKAVMNYCGMYDPHLLVRRFCDWDLWQRMHTYGDFVQTDELVSIVYANMDDSIGRTVDFDYDIVKKYMGLKRDEHLTPANILEYEVDALTAFDGDIAAQDTEIIYRKIITPYYVTHRSFLGNRPIKYNRQQTEARRVLVTKAHFDTTIDITIGNYAELVSGEKEVTPFFIAESALLGQANLLERTDVVCLHRAMGYESNTLLKEALLEGKPTAFLMDDHLLCFYDDYGVEFEYLAPGTPMYNYLLEAVKSADINIVYDDIVAEDIREINPRVFRLETNISANYVLKAKDELTAKDTEKKRFAFIGGSARKQELQWLWPVLQEFAERYRDKIEWYFWGIDPAELGGISGEVHVKPFTFDYCKYLTALRRQKFDFVFVPLFDDKKSKQAKCPIKYLEAMVAGAIGMFSDSEPYRNVIDGETGLKTENRLEAWAELFEKAYSLTCCEREKILQNAYRDITENFTTEAQVDDFLRTFYAAEVHASLRAFRHEDGKPRVAYFIHSPYLGGAEIHILRHAFLAKKNHLEPIVCLPEELKGYHGELIDRCREENISLGYLPFQIYTAPHMLNTQNLQNDAMAIAQWLKDEKIAMIHCVTLVPKVYHAARAAGLPVISSLYAVDENTVAQFAKDRQYHGLVQAVHSDSLRYANTWSALFRSDAYIIRSAVPGKYFINARKKKESNCLKVLVSGTLQERKGQLQVIEAAAALSKKGYDIELTLIGYDNLVPDYAALCRASAKERGLEGKVRFAGFVRDPSEYLLEADILICASDFESLPQVILEAMAARVFVISTRVGGIAEVLTDQYTGIALSSGDTAGIVDGVLKYLSLTRQQRETILENAFTMIKQEASSAFVERELLKMYANVLRHHKHRRQGDCRTDQEIREAAQVQSQEGGPPRPAILPKALLRTEIVSGLIPEPGRIFSAVKRFKLQPKMDGWAGIEVAFGTHARRNDGQMKIVVRPAKLENVKLRERILKLADLPDSQMVSIDFEPIKHSGGQEFIIEFIPVSVPKRHGVCLYEAYPGKPFGRFSQGLLYGKMIYEAQ